MKQYYKILEQIGAVEQAILAALDEQSPADSVPDSIAIPLLNRLEERGEAVTEAVNLIREEIENLLAS